MAAQSGATRQSGGKVAAVIADHVAKAVVATHENLADHKRSQVQTILSDWFDLVDSEIDATLGPLLGKLANHPDLPPELAPLLKFMHQGKGQWKTLVMFGTFGAVMGGGLGNLITNYLNPVILPLIADSPHGIISPQEAATAYLRGIGGQMDMRREARLSGINDPRFDALVGLATEHLDGNNVMEALNRGLINEQTARQILQLGSLSESEMSVLLELRKAIISPQELAVMVNFGAIDQADAAVRARLSGMSEDDFGLLVYSTGQPPDYTDLMDAFRRGIIDDARFTKGIVQGPIRLEWIDMIKALRFGPMSTSDAIMGAVQGHLTLAQAQAIAAQNGLEAAHFQPLYDTAGEPPGVMEMVSLWHRGEFTEAQLIAGIRESRLKNKYIPALLAGTNTLPPERTIVSLMTHGAITDEQGTALLRQRGYADDIVAAFVGEAHVVKTTKVHELTVAEIVALYEDLIIDRVQAATMLTDLGEPIEVSQAQLELADMRRVRRANDAAINAVRSAMLSRSIDEGSASLALDQLHVPPAQRDQLLVLWVIELSMQRRHLSLAQVEAAYRKGVITVQDFTARLLAMGYVDTDVQVILATLDATAKRPVVGP